MRSSREARYGVLAAGSYRRGERVGDVLEDGSLDVPFDPDGGGTASEVPQACVRANENNAGIYGTVTRVGRLAVGQSIVLHQGLPG